MILISNINLPLDTDFSDCRRIAAQRLKINIDKIKSAGLYRKSVDARRKSNIHFCVSLIVQLLCDEARIIENTNNAQLFRLPEYVLPHAAKKPVMPPVVVGFGPAGMFAALTLARAGLCPLVIERGEGVDERRKTVEAFFSGAPLDRNSNIQFGEGGAGTFSDGKLNTGIKDVRCRSVLEAFRKFGAPDSIMYEAKPHIGTDILGDIVRNIRREIIRLGGNIRFCTRASDIDADKKQLTITSAAGEEQIAFSDLILAIGHSARDTFELLNRIGVPMQQKPFSVGVRVEHRQSDINRAMYGAFAEHPALGAADYKLAVHLANGRGVYTFCMCPGGTVVNSSSEPDGIVTNGMSNSARDGKNANSAVLVGIEPSDLPDNGVLSGMEFQRTIENRAYMLTGGAVPVQSMGDFLGISYSGGNNVAPTVKPNTKKIDMHDIFPKFVSDSLCEGIRQMDKKLPGFCSASAVLSAPETRSSSPVRIVRGDDFSSVFAPWLYPCGEGAGYAGGIMSAAVDGIRCAEKIIEKNN